MSNVEISLDTGEPWIPDPHANPHAAPNAITTGEDSTVIAPWLTPDEPPTPPPKQPHQRAFGFAPKRSMPSFSIHRQLHTSSSVRSRGSDSNSLADSFTSDRTSASELKKLKTTMNFGPIKRIIKKKSKVGRDDLSASTTTLVPPYSPSAPMPSSSFLLPPSPPPPLPKKGRRRHPKSPGLPPPPPPKEPEFKLDTDLDRMEGIVDMNVLLPDPGRGDSSSPGSGFESSLSTSDGGLHALSSLPQGLYHSSSSSTMFSNPFLPNPSGRRKIAPAALDLRKVSPKTIVPTQPPPPPVASTSRLPPDPEPHSPSWIPPESWHVEKEGEIPEVPDYSSSDYEGPAPVNVNMKLPRRRTRNPKRPYSMTTYYIRIHRLDGTYHVVRCPLTATVAELIPVMNRKVLLDPKQETHSLYVKERERERVLAPTERPADLVRRRLEQAGYDVADGLQNLGSDEIGFLIKFIYKSNLLGGAGERDIMVNDREYVDLTGRSLKTIPVVLHTHADTIISLNLSRNPMLEIPLDFIQSCVTLRELRLSNMAMKKVPQSVRHSVSLHRLDISCNRIADLDDAGLDRIPNLHQLKAQNNRMDKLPWYFPRLRALKFLNISNNKFQLLPSVIPEMKNLVDLDISFNNISTLPPEIGNLASLERLVVVGNQISKIPDECTRLVNLTILDCRRNHISDLSLVCKLPKLNTLLADNNTVHALDLDVGYNMECLDVSYNDITQLTVVYGPQGLQPYRLKSLNISHAKLHSFEGFPLSHLTTLTELRLDHNSFRFIPEALGSLTALVHFSCSDNQLDALPESLGLLQNLETLDVHNNVIKEIPATVWECASLHTINMTSNALGIWHDPRTPTGSVESVALPDSPPDAFGAERKASATPSLASQFGGRPLPPLAHSLRRLYLGENRLTEDVLHPMTALKGLQVLNLSFNEIQDLPSSFFRNLVNLEELYLSGNKLSAIPTEDLHRLSKLTVLFLNGNKLQVLPHELSLITSLTILDVASNMLRYNINNWEFDWNWNFNENLQYLNLSGNKRLRIQPDASQRMSVVHYSMSQRKVISDVAPLEQRRLLHDVAGPQQRKVLSDFAGLPQLRVLGLMDVTTIAASSIPEETEDRRVRTSLSEVNRMAYGIADTLDTQNHNLSMIDLVAPEFRERSDECIFAMFGRSHAHSSNNRLSKYLSENFLKTFIASLEKLDRNTESVGDALRRSFLTLNKNMHAYFTADANYNRKMSQASAVTLPVEWSSSKGGTAGTHANTTAKTIPVDLSILKGGASGIVAYFAGKTIYIANAGDALAVISRQGSAKLVSTKHEPFDRNETARIRNAEGWVSPQGAVNEEIEVSRSFGFYHLLPAVNPRPDICKWDLSDLDEFLIIANRGLWDFVSYQTAVDIARTEKNDPMIAAQKLRDFAISYGANGSTMIMVISVADLFLSRSRQPTVGSLSDLESYITRRPKPKTDNNVPGVRWLPNEVPAPTGQIAMVFTDIRNSTHLWEANPGMPTAMRLHNTLLRRQLRLCGGYEVKTEGDAFMCSFPTVISALLWTLEVQVQLLHQSWPLEILECEDGKEIKDSQGQLIARGLSVRMGIHWGTPLCEPDPITNRMDYFGPMVNKSARICGSAAGGQIMCSADVYRDIKARIFDNTVDKSIDQAQMMTIDAIRRIGVHVVNVGETKMKGVEVPEVLSLVYPEDLAGRKELKDNTSEPDASGSKVQFSVIQMRSLASLCVRLEVLTSSRVFRPVRDRKNSTQSLPNEAPPADGVIMYADPEIFIPNITEKASDQELMALLDSLSIRIENALASLTLRQMGDVRQNIIRGLEDGGQPSQELVTQLLGLLQTIFPASS